jgi:putative peptidoglycan lipid II flippase
VLGRAAAGISGWTLVSRLTGLGRVLVATAVLGTTFLGNTYQMANTVPNVVFELFAAGALHAVLVPTLVEALDGEGRAGVERVAGGVLGAVLAGLGALTAIAMALSPLVMRVLASGVDDPAVQDTQILLGTVFLLVFLPQVVLYGVGLVATGALHAAGRFTAPAVAPIANSVVVIAVYVAFWRLCPTATDWPAEGLTPLEVAVLAGGTTLGVVALVAVPVVALARTGVRPRPRWTPRDPQVRRLASHGGSALTQVAAAQLLLVVVLVLANASAGGVVAFQYAFTFFLLPFALVAVPVATAVFPTLSRRAGSDRAEVGYASVARRAVVVVVALLAPATAALAALAWPLVRLTAFGEAAASGLAPLAHALVALAPGLVGYGLVLVFTRAAYARGDARTPAVLLLVCLAAAAVAMVALAPLADAADRVTVLAALHSAGYLLAAGAMAWAQRHELGPGRVGASVARVVGAAAVSGVVMALVAGWLDPSGRAASLLVIAGVGVGGLALYLGLLRLLGADQRDLFRLDEQAAGDG